MSHLLYEGEVCHKRLIPKVHEFTYPFYLLDIDLEDMASLDSKLLRFNPRDHFGKSDDFLKNVEELLEKFDIVQESVATMRFLTLPRMFNFVFNPISILVLFNKNKMPTQMLVEVHNYNGGRVVYPVKLIHKSGTKYCGSVLKDMHVSPFLKRDGVYKFVLNYTKEHLNLSITLFEENEKTLTASLKTASHSYTIQSARAIFFRHLFLTFRVVTRTLWQALKLRLKGLEFFSPTPQDQIRRY
ncbi:MAG TPA: DUF1365 domain-containing protein [Epsilonproteobacteria bacterium]|nr:DUF1365 domain-containing protein [Campylobacterota bacterium]